MFLPRGLTVNEVGHLEINKVDACTLQQKYGTPLYVYNVNLIRERMREFKDALAMYQPNGKVAYASKACSMIGILNIVKEEGLHVDVVSGGELYTALKAGISVEKIHFHGNNKSIEEIQYALDNKIGCFIVDNFYELNILAEQVKLREQHTDILLRVTPGVEAHTHDYILTGQEDSKFGFDLQSGAAKKAVVQALSLPFIHVKGLHCHIGSQIFETSGFLMAVNVLINHLSKWNREFGYVAEVLNVGGGFGIQYTSLDKPKPVSYYIQEIVQALYIACQEKGIDVPTLWFEPGRILVGDAGHTLYTIGSQKHIPHVRDYVAIDGGMADNIRPALYEAKYEACLANRMNEQIKEKVSIAGKCCESGDMLIWDLQLPKPIPNDLLAVFCTGAYGYSMASNYNRLLKPAVVFVEDGIDTLVVKRETYEDLVRNEYVYTKEIIPEKV
ncbi:MAG: diaminopimelate decarboxylase [Bacillaceae bacterium]